MKSFIQTSKVLILSIAVLTVLGYAQAAWDAPSGAPSESNNAPAPINVSDSSQIKSGNITANVIGAGGFCLGTDCITEWPTGGDDGSDGVVNITTVNFDGTSCPNEGDSCTIRSSNNVSSVIKENVRGNYTINFDQSFSNNHYVLSGSSSYNGGGRGSAIEIRTLEDMKDDKVSISVVLIDTSPQTYDLSVVTVMIVGE